MTANGRPTSLPHAPFPAGVSKYQPQSMPASSLVFRFNRRQALVMRTVTALLSRALLGFFAYRRQDVSDIPERGYAGCPTPPGGPMARALAHLVANLAHFRVGTGDRLVEHECWPGRTCRRRMYSRCGGGASSLCLQWFTRCSVLLVAESGRRWVSKKVGDERCGEPGEERAYDGGSTTNHFPILESNFRHLPHVMHFEQLPNLFPNRLLAVLLPSASSWAH